uniref:Uncharacterized protein n=1 Tax=Cyprinus carpio TaxID=7962 RepID=A0A8C1ZPV1_CYPCA
MAPPPTSTAGALLSSPSGPEPIFWVRRNPYNHNPLKPWAAISLLPLQRSVHRQIDDVMALCSAGAGGGAFLGGLLGGPLGIFIGGTLGSAVGWWMTRGQFRRLHQTIMEMSPQQREKLNYSLEMKHHHTIKQQRKTNKETNMYERKINSTSIHKKQTFTALTKHI